MIEHLSYSSVNLYLTCARAWRFRYIDKVKTPIAVALPFGSAFHDAIENYIRTNNVQKLKAGGTTPPVSSWFSKCWQSQVEREQDIDFGKESFESMADLGQRMLGNEIDVTGGGPNRKCQNASVFLNDIVPMTDEHGPIIEKKITLRVPGVEVPIIGYIDLITSDGVPCDFKTSGRAWYAAKAHSELQPSFYLTALTQLGQVRSDFKFRYYIFTKTKKPKIQIIETKRTLGQLFWLMDLIGEVWQGIQAGVFPPTGPGSWKCGMKYCEFWPMCRGK